MAKDSFLSRFSKKQKSNRLDEISMGNRSIEDIESEEELLANTEKVEPIKADAKPGRNDLCPCGSGKKYKKCCGREG